MSQVPALGTRVLRSLGLTVLIITGVFCAMLAFSSATAGQLAGWPRLLVPLSLVLAAVAAFAMTADCFDLWVLGRRMTAYRVSVIHSLVFVTFFLAVVVSVLSGTPGLLLVMTPALIIYVFTVWRPRKSSRPAPAGRGGSTGPRRQKRGGKKRS